MYQNSRKYSTHASHVCASVSAVQIYAMEFIPSHVFYYIYFLSNATDCSFVFIVSFCITVMWSASSHLGLARSDLRARGAHGQTRVNTSPPRLHVQLAHCAPRAAERSSDVSKHVRCNAKLATQLTTHASQAAREDDPSTAAAQAVHRVRDVVLHSVVQTTVQARPTEEDVEAQPEVRQPREQSMLPAATSGCGCADLVVLCHWKVCCVEVCGGSVT